MRGTEGSGDARAHERFEYSAYESNVHTPA